MHNAVMTYIRHYYNSYKYSDVIYILGGILSDLEVEQWKFKSLTNAIL